MRQAIVKAENHSITRPANKSKTAVALLEPQSTGPMADDAVRLCAFERWEAAGKPDGDGVSFWLEAERELSHAT